MVAKVGMPSKLPEFDLCSIPEPNSGCWIWEHATWDGYGVYMGRSNAHRVAWKRKYGPIPKGMHVLHKCDVRCCVNPEHLFLGTNRDNVDDRVAKDRTAFGSKSGAAKLTQEQIDYIRSTRVAHRKVTVSSQELAERFGVSRVHIDRIRVSKRRTKREK